MNTEAWETGGEGKALDLEDDAEEESFADFTHYDEKNEWDEQVYLVGVEFAAGDKITNTFTLFAEPGTSTPDHHSRVYGSGNLD